MIKDTINGNLISAFKENSLDGLVHGCNCFCIMGAGIARSIRDEFPDAYREDLKTTPGSKDKLGMYSSLNTEFGTIINAYTQYDFGSEKMDCDYSAIKKAFETINVDFASKTLGIPYIGCGLAGGSWEIVSDIIDKATPNVNIIVYYL